MRTTFVRNPLPLITLFGVTLPALGHADCIPTAPVEPAHSVDFTMVSLSKYRNGSSLASYTTGTLDYTSHSFLFRGTTLAGTDARQWFSDRTFEICFDAQGQPELCGPQQFASHQSFNVNAPDNLGISISDGYNIEIGRPAIDVTFTLESWGNGQIHLTGTCDATSDELYLTSSTGMYLMTFGTPYSTGIK